MESISRPLPRNHHAASANFSRKLSNANGFSAKNAYDDVFAGPPKFGAPTFSSRVEDYSEIFGSSRASSIPVLDLSDLDQENVSADFRTSTPDYSSIFVGFRDDDEIGMSYEEMFAGPRGGGAINTSSAIAKTRTPSATKPPLQHSGRLNSFEQNQAFSPEAPNQSFDAVKQFNMSYHKTSQKIKDVTKMTMHVAELDAVPGFTCFIDAAAPQHKTQGGKEKPSAINDVRQKMDFSEGTPEGKNNSKATSPLAKKQTSGGAVRSRSGSSWDGTYSNDKLFNAHEIHLNSHPSKVSPPSSLQANLEKSKGHFKRSMASNKEFPKTDARDCSPDSSDEELDVNSAAAASVAALRKAIEKAQESIRIAKELMEKKEGPQNYSKKGSKSSLKVKGRRENSVATQGNRTKEQNNKETCVRADAALQSFTDMERKNASRSEEVALGFKEGDAIYRGKIHENLDAAENCEAARFSELVNTGKHGRAISAFERADVKNNITSTGKHEHEYQEMKPTGETLEQQEEIIEKAAQVEKAYELEEDIERKQDVFKMAQDWEENGDTLESTYVVHEPEENEKPGTAQEVEETEEKREGFYGQKNCEGKLEELLETTEDEEFFESQDWDEKDNAKRLNGSLELVENEHKQEVPEQELIEKKMKDAEIEENENILREIQDEEVIAKRLEEAFQGVENENRPREACGSSSNEPKQKYAHAEEVSEKRLDKVHEQKMNEEEATGAHDEKDSAEKVPECEWEGNETRATWANVYEAENIWIERDASEGNERIEVDEKRPTDAHDWKESEENISVCERDGNEKTVAGAYRYENAENIQRETDESEENEEIEVDEKRLTDAHDGKESENNMEEWEEEVSDKRVAGAYRYDAAENIQRETDGSEESEEIEVPEEALYDNHFNRVSDASSRDASSHDANYSTSETEETCQHEINDNNVKTSPQVNDNNGSPLGVYKAFCEFDVDEAEAVEAGYRLKKKEMPKIAGLVECDAEGDGKDASEALRLRDDGNVVNVGSTDLDIGENQVEQHTEDSELASDLENGIDILVNEFRENDEIVKEDEIAFGVEAKSNPETAHGERWWAENPKEMEASEVSSASKEKERTTEFDEEIKTREDTGKNEESLNKNFAMEEKDSKETASKEVAAKDDLREIEEANKREREREKDRLVVERAIREARERAFAEARERAERAAVERATAEVRQRVLAESRQKLDNASAGTKSSAEKASLVAKLRAERAAVERATSEARERALEKALSQKTTSEARPQAERFVTEKFSGASGNVSSSDSQRFDGTNAESSQRSKARLEKHQRIMQRAAKALEEKNMRDLLAQKEQAERNRLSESLDADIKRWSSGKEGNLRALLSTLQYILGPGSGWQSVSLTDIVTTSAVKKAYRKATLYVHPDKLQQRRASIQQKYICEKVFDLLKAAWNKFNSEER